MSVDPDISRRIIREEMVAVDQLAAEYKWMVSKNDDDLTVTVRMKSAIDGEEYVVEAKCDGYRATPPLFEFIHPTTGERGKANCYPNDSGRGQPFFHSMPCICIQWNRKAYSQGGPHSGDWVLTEWASKVPGQVLLGDMFHLIQREINLKSCYKGRMG